MTVDIRVGPEVGDPERRRYRSEEDVVTSSPLRVAVEAVARSLALAAYLLAPLLMRPPAGLDTLTPVWDGDRRWRAEARKGRRDAAALVAAPIVLDPVAGRVVQDAADWLDRVAVRFGRLSAWRNARPRTTPLPAVVGPTCVTGGPRPWLPGTVDSVSASTSGAVVAASPIGRRRPADDQPQFPIDVVYTWVDDRDPAWQASYAQAVQDFGHDGLDAETASPARFHNRDELRYSLRSLARHAPFVRNVYIVTAGQVPAWLETAAPNVRVVPHEEILGPDCLPTFNSHAVESRLHHIQGLAEHYLYLNDDFFFGRDCQAATFFTPDGRPKAFFDQRAMVPDGLCSPADRPVDSASKNTREIVAAEFDYVVKYKMQHAPYAQRRSVLFEMEQRFRRAFKQTARNPFRHHTDVNVPSCFSHYYGLRTGAAVPGQIQGAYINIGNPWAQLRMRRLWQRADRDVFCLNDTPMRPRRRALVDASVGAFLEAYFPVPSPYERDPVGSVAAPPEADHVGEAVQRG